MRLTYGQPRPQKQIKGGYWFLFSRGHTFLICLRLNGLLDYYNILFSHKQEPVHPYITEPPKEHWGKDIAGC